ncbi:MAG: hypothetical protein KKB20_16170 [Proteobacteria bacterium]|nr:hypothetical protein [Pseudomonadota bacterium]
MAKRKKKPYQKENPTSGKKARGVKKAESTHNQCLVWQSGTMDRGGAWGWEKIDPVTWWDTICPARHDFQTMKWINILGDKHHLVSIGKLEKQAQDRLAEICQDDVDELCCLRLGATERIWGVKEAEKFKVLWWDPNHEIYPYQLKHT